jgi:hypothetical protein
MRARPDSVEEKMAEILESHFENHQNPHETIHQMWALLHLEAEPILGTIAKDQTRH